MRAHFLLASLPTLVAVLAAVRFILNTNPPLFRVLNKLPQVSLEVFAVVSGVSPTKGVDINSLIFFLYAEYKKLVLCLGYSLSLRKWLLQFVSQETLVWAC